MMQGPLHKKWWCQSREIDKKWTIRTCERHWTALWDTQKMQKDFPSAKGLLWGHCIANNSSILCSLCRWQVKVNGLCALSGGSTLDKERASLINNGILIQMVFKFT
jgi:hypothetical protein